jgi:phosphoribosylformylglycinamidine synthase
MAGSVMPIAVSHGEGRAGARCRSPAALQQSGLVGLRFVDNRGNVTEQYLRPTPTAPRRHHRGDHRGRPRHHHDAAPGAGVPHRANSWHPDNWGEDGAWMRMFRNARVRLG